MTRVVTLRAPAVVGALTRFAPHVPHIPPPVRPADLVFRHRFAAFALVFGTSFAFAAVDHTPAAVRVARVVARLAPAVSAEAVVRGLFWAGALLVVAAAALRTWATAYLHSRVVHGDTVQAAALVADGPYRRVRNPLYLGGVLMALGYATVPPLTGAVWMVGGVLAVSLALVAVEERALAASMPERFAAYRRAVPAFVPALAPRLPAGPARPAWGQAFLGELFFWSFALGAVVFAATLDARWSGAISLAGVAAGSLLTRRGRTPAPAPAA